MCEQGTHKKECFKGCANPVESFCGGKAYFVLKNPEDSGMNIFVNNINCTNLSCTPTECRVFTGNVCTKKLRESDNVINSDTGTHYSKPKGRIYYGCDVCTDELTCCEILSVPSFNTLQQSMCECGSLTIVPGVCLVIEAGALTGSTGCNVCSFDWCEDKK